MSLVAAAVLWVTASGCGGSVRESIRPLRLVAAPTPRLVSGLYDASGRYPQIAGAGSATARVNAALWRALRSDQRRYVSGIGIPAGVVTECGGIYSTRVDPRYVSASTVVVSALVPALELYPCGNDGSGWLSVTVRVPSGRAVDLRELFRDDRHGLLVLAAGWRQQFGRQSVGKVLLRAYPQDFRAPAFKHAFFALTSRGLAVGFWQDGPTLRLVATVPYSVLGGELSALGKALVAGVRAPSYHGGIPSRVFGPSVPMHARVTFRTVAAPSVACEVADHLPRLPTHIVCARARPRPLGVEIGPSGRLRVCRACVVSSARLQPLHYGEWVETSTFFCMSLRQGLGCFYEDGNSPNDDGGFVLGAHLVRLCPRARPCSRRRTDRATG